ncbi:MAG: hypothetical protein RIF41_02650 [Polyangiaceae bacterium]
MTSALVVITAACGGGDEPSNGLTTGSTTGSGGAGASGGTLAMGGNGGAETECSPEPSYPAGPYGSQVGDVIANLQLRGYRNDLGEGLATAQGVSEYSLDDARLACKGYALIHLSDVT